MILPTLGGVTFCKKWHMGYTYFGYCPRAASHLHPAGAIIGEVVAAMATDRAAIAVSAATTLKVGGARPAPPLFPPATADTSLDYSGKVKCAEQQVGIGEQEMVGNDRCQGSLTPPPPP